MPVVGRGRLLDSNIILPAQMVLSAGQAGEGLNPFMAPSKWATAVAVVVAGAASVPLLTPPANKSLRLFRYTLGTTAHLGYPLFVLTWLGGTIIQLYPVLTVGSPAMFREEFGPTGIAIDVGSAFRVSCSGFGVTARFFIQYSLEPYGAQNDGD